MANTTVRCWGINGSGTLGDGTVLASAVPVTVSGLSGVTQLAAQGNNVCAVRSGGTVWCWGDNRSGQLGVTTPGQSATPVQVPGVASATAVAVGNFHSGALLAIGAVGRHTAIARKKS
jgi:alpha-tubulin suppressor-like RCC1 family protein